MVIASLCEAQSHEQNSRVFQCRALGIGLLAVPKVWKSVMTEVTVTPLPLMARLPCTAGRCDPAPLCVLMFKWHRMMTQQRAERQETHLRSDGDLE